MLDEDRGPQLVIIIWIFAFLASAVLCIKVWTRFKILHQSGIEDIFVFLAWVRAASELKESRRAKELTRIGAVNYLQCLVDSQRPLGPRQTSSRNFSGGP